MTVAWRRLELSGFGRFESETVVEFQRGVNVLVAPNESGKSTLAAGVAAVLFGLPATSNPDEFGQGRWRNWHNPARFEGALEFVAHGRTYRIRRRFADHAVTVSEQVDGGWRDIVTGTHNPNARRPNVAYDSFLAETIGVVSRDLFMTTFSFAQPLPQARELDENVQRLISGAGAGQFADALEALAQRGRSLTKFTKALELTPGDGRNDGELEALDARIGELRAAIEASRTAVDERHAVQQRLAALQTQVHELRQQLERSESDIDVWSEWQKLRDEHLAALQQQSQLERAWDTYKRLEADLQSQQRLLAAQFPDLAEAPANTDELLDELQRLQDSLSAQRRELTAALTALQKRGVELVNEWEQFVKERERWRELRRTIDADFAVFERADEEGHRYLAAYNSTKAALELQLAQARQELERVREGQSALEQQRARFRDAFGDLERLGDDAVVAVDERLSMLQEKEQLEAALAAARTEHERNRRGRLGVLAAAATAAAAAAFGGYAVSAPVWLIGLLAVAGVAAVAALVLFGVRSGASPDMERLAAQLHDVAAALADDDRLGAFANSPAHELGALRERLLARREAAAALAAREAATPAVDEELATRIREATAQLEHFMSVTHEARVHFGDSVQEAYARWNRLRHEASRLEQALVAFSRRHFGVDTTEPERLAVSDLQNDGVSASWRDAAQFVIDADLAASVEGVGAEHTVAGDDSAAAVTIAQVVEALSHVTAAHVEAAAAARAGRRSDLAALEDQIFALKQRLEPILAETDGDVSAAKKRWAEYKKALAAVDGLQKELAGVLAGQGASSADDLHVRSRQAANVVMDAYRRWQELADKDPTLPRPDDGTEDVDARIVVQQLVQRRDELKRQQRAAEEELLTAREQLADLTGRHVINVALAEEELAALERRRAEVEEEVQVIALAHRELRHAVDSFRQSHRERLAERASRYLQQFTGRARQVVLDEQFRVAVQDPDGPLHNVSQLSQGAQDQLYLALRLAVADLVADDVAVPLLMDDPFVHCDDERLNRIHASLTALAEDRQIVLFSHRDVFRAWGAPVSVTTKGAVG